MIPDLVVGEFDVILSGMSITAKREELIDFTEAYYPPTPSVYVARVGAGDEAVQGAIGVTASTIYSDYFTKIGRPFVSIDGSVDVVDALLVPVCATRCLNRSIRTCRQLDSDPPPSSTR